jgi:hypothetical protein
VLPSCDFATAGSHNEFRSDPYVQTPAFARGKSWACCLLVVAALTRPPQQNRVHCRLSEPRRLPGGALHCFYALEWAERGKRRVISLASIRDGALRVLFKGITLVFSAHWAFLVLRLVTLAQSRFQKMLCINIVTDRLRRELHREIKVREEQQQRQQQEEPNTQAPRPRQSLFMHRLCFSSAVAPTATVINPSCPSCLLPTANILAVTLSSIVLRLTHHMRVSVSAYLLPFSCFVFVTSFDLLLISWLFVLPNSGARSISEERKCHE